MQVTTHLNLYHHFNNVKVKYYGFSSNNWESSRWNIAARDKQLFYYTGIPFLTPNERMSLVRKRKSHTTQWILGTWNSYFFWFCLRFLMDTINCISYKTDRYFKFIFIAFSYFIRRKEQNKIGGYEF